MLKLKFMSLIFWASPISTADVPSWLMQLVLGVIVLANSNDWRPTLLGDQYLWKARIYCHTDMFLFILPPSTGGLCCLVNHSKKYILVIPYTICWINACRIILNWFELLGIRSRGLSKWLRFCFTSGIKRCSSLKINKSLFKNSAKNICYIIEYKYK